MKYIDSYLNLVVTNELKTLKFNNQIKAYRINGNYLIFDIGPAPHKLVIMYYIVVELLNNEIKYSLKFKFKVVNVKEKDYNFKESDEIMLIVLFNDKTINDTDIKISFIDIIIKIIPSNSIINFSNIEVKSSDGKNEINEKPWLLKLLSTEKKEKKLFLDALSNTLKPEFIQKLLATQQSLQGLSENIAAAAKIAAIALEEEALKALEKRKAELEKLEEKKAELEKLEENVKKLSNVYDNPIPATIKTYLVKKHPKKALIYLQYLMFIFYDKCNIRDTQNILGTVNANLNILDIFNLDNIDDIVDIVGFYSPTPDIPKIPVPTLRTFVRKYNEVINDPNSNANLICAYGIDIYSKKTEDILKTLLAYRPVVSGGKKKKHPR